MICNLSDPLDLDEALFPPVQLVLWRRDEGKATKDIKSKQETTTVKCCEKLCCSVYCSPWGV